MAFIDDHRAELGIEPICQQLAVAPSAYRRHAARRIDPGKRPARARRDDDLKGHIRRVHEGSFGLYGARKVWRQLLREQIRVARCTVERLMKTMGLTGVRRGKTCVTTVPDRKAACPLDKVNRTFRVERPNALWVVDFTYVHTWAGFVYVAFVIDAFARRIVGWKVSASATAGFVLDALEQAIHARRPTDRDKLVHHSDSPRDQSAVPRPRRAGQSASSPPPRPKPYTMPQTSSPLWRHDSNETASAKPGALHTSTTARLKSARVADTWESYSQAEVAL